MRRPLTRDAQRKSFDEETENENDDQKSTEFYADKEVFVPEREERGGEGREERRGREEHTETTSTAPFRFYFLG